MGSGAAATATAPRPHPAPEPDKMFKCPTCKRIFNKKANLKVHSRKHTGEKPYACSKPGCGRAFMWKSSVTFHEQNCPSAKRADVPVASASRAVHKRPKAISSSTASTPAHSPARTPIKPIASSARGRRARPRPMPTTPVTPEDALTRACAAASVRDELALALPTLPSRAPACLPATRPLPQDGLPISFALAPGGTPQPLLPPPGLSPSPSVLSHAALFGGPMGSPPPPPSPPAPPLPTGLGAPLNQTDVTLPAPATLLAEKRVQSGGGRPPIIPVSLPKHFYALQTKEAGAGCKPLFDLRVPASSSVGGGVTGGGCGGGGASSGGGSGGVSSGGGGSAMMFGSKAYKMPIAMELDDSDDEGTSKVIGAQESFLRTGNPFGGFAPPTRCSPLPLSSPIVGPGISPMPLSPLAPFSPLPADSPAHNAPNPVHPPLHQACFQASLRSNSSW